MTKEQRRDELTEIIIQANEEWLKKYGRMHLHLEHKSQYIADNVHNAGYRKQEEGRWKGAGMGDYYCSLCNTTYSGGDEYNYCPNCGAKMKEDE